VSDWHQDPASWSPDGKVLAFAQNHPETGWDIWLLHVEGERHEEPFLRTEFDEFNPMISPSGKALAYRSDESGRPEVYAQSFPQGGRRWLVSTEGGTAPMWARDGKELFYRNGPKLLAVRVETKPAFALGKPRELFESSTRVSGGYGLPDYDVTADGRRFLMIPLPPEATRNRINVVLNFDEELKRRVPVE
jgi:dipeptidyl aminopeptidase/acylaminoacyl peptidase